MKINEVLFEVLQGWSEILYDKDSVAYFRHPTILESLIEKKEYSDFEERGKAAGLSTEDELIDAAYKGGKWTQEEEYEIKDLIFSTNGLRRVLAKQSEPSLQKSTERKIEEEQARLDELKRKRSSLVSASLENFILLKSTIHFCSKRLFEDKEMTKPIDNIDKILDSYNLKLAELIKKENLIKAAFYPSFFDLFYLYGEQPYKILNKTGGELTVFQKDLLVYGFVLNQKIKMSEIPKLIKKDPVQLFDYDITQKSKSRQPEEVEEHFNPRNFVEKHGGVDKLTADHYLNG